MKKLKTSSTKQKVGFKGLVYSLDERLLGAEYSPNAYNFTFRNGVLKSDLGIEYAAGYNKNSALQRYVFDSIAPYQKIKDAFIYHRRKNGEYDDKVVVQTSDGVFLYTSIFKNEGWTEIDGLNSKKDVSVVSYNYNGEDILLISNAELGLMIFDGESVSKVDNSLGFSSVTVHFERVFGVANGKENQVWFSSVLDPTNWTVSDENAGYITFQDECGNVEKIVSFLGYLYIFREHGIFRLTAYGDQSEFSLKKVFTDTGRIYKNTIALCGNKIMFYTDEGIFAFDGYSVTRLNLEVPSITLPTAVSGAYMENKYYLCCKIDLEDYYDQVMTNNCILEYDLKEKSLSILAPYDAVKIVPMQVHHATDLLVVSTRNKTDYLGMITERGRIFDENSTKFYRSPYNDMGTDRLKIVREMIVNTRYPLTVTVKYDDQERSFDFRGSQMPQKVFVDRCGQKIGFVVKSTYINNLLAPITVKIDLV